MSRAKRQAEGAQWCADTFGIEHQSSVRQRGVRNLEEAIEVYQAAGGSRAMALKLVTHVFANEPGNLAQELGGLGLTTLLLAAAAGLDADECEAKELARVQSKSAEHFRKRNEAKNNAGFYAIAPEETVR